MGRPRKVREPLRATTLRLPWALVREGKIRAMDEGRDFQDIAADALRLYFATPIKKESKS